MAQNNLKGFTIINIGGKKRPFKFGTNATALYCNIKNCTLGEFQKQFEPEKLKAMAIKGDEVRDLLWAGLVAGCKSEKSEVTFDEYEVGDWIDEMDQDELTKAFSVMATSGDSKKK